MKEQRDNQGRYKLLVRNLRLIAEGRMKLPPFRIVPRVSDRSGANEVSGPTKEDGTHAERDPQGDAQEENPQ